MLYLIQFTINAGPLLHISPIPPDHNVSRKGTVRSSARRSYKQLSEHSRPPNDETVVVTIFPLYMVHILNNHVHTL